MTDYEFVGSTLITATAVTDIIGTTSAANVYHGLRPLRSDLPSINYYAIGGRRQNAMEIVSFSIMCRASTPAAALDLARKVVTVFSGTAGTGMYGTNNSFDVARSSLVNYGGLITEPEDDVFNAPVEIRLVYPSKTVT